MHVLYYYYYYYTIVVHSARQCSSGKIVIKIVEISGARRRTGDAYVHAVASKNQSNFAAAAAVVAAEPCEPKTHANFCISPGGPPLARRSPAVGHTPTPPPPFFGPGPGPLVTSRHRRRRCHHRATDTTHAAAT